MVKYPTLDRTPIREIVFSISYNEIIDTTCFERFVESKDIKSSFEKIVPLLERSFRIDNKGLSQSNSNKANGYQLRNKNEVIQLRNGSFSYHYLNEYRDFDKILSSITSFWERFISIVKKDALTITNVIVRYINVIEDKSNSHDISHLIQLYPKRSNDRDVLNFQNSVTFKYQDNPEFLITTVSTQVNKNTALLDITVVKDISLINEETKNLSSLFRPIREIKNRVFFDSITAKALIKYIK